MKQCEKCCEPTKKLYKCPYLFMEASHPRRDHEGYVQFFICKKCYDKATKVSA